MDRGPLSRQTDTALWFTAPLPSPRHMRCETLLVALLLTGPRTPYGTPGSFSFLVVGTTARAVRAGHPPRMDRRDHPGLHPDPQSIDPDGTMLSCVSRRPYVARWRIWWPSGHAYGTIRVCCFISCNRVVTRAAVHTMFVYNAHAPANK